MLAALTAAPALPDKDSEPGKPVDLRVLAFNIWFAGTAVPNELDHVDETIRMHDADVVLLSEAGAATQRIAEELPTPGQPYYAASSGDARIVLRSRSSARPHWPT